MLRVPHLATECVSESGWWHSNSVKILLGHHVDCSNLSTQAGSLCGPQWVLISLAAYKRAIKDSLVPPRQEVL